MSNGQPPYPPFRPNFPPSGLPPFPPKNGGGPPFPPSYPQGGRQQNAYPPPGGHPGLGLPRPPTGLPQPPHHNPNANSRGGPPPRRGGDDAKTTKVFVGGIAPGVGDRTLRDLLNACGQLYDLIRVEGANGKPQAFGFALFENPEDVLRCIRCLNGIELPDLSPEGRRAGNPPKALVVKADQKTAAFLSEFEENLGRFSDESADAACRKAIDHIVGRLNEANNRSDDRPNRSGRLSPIQVVVPAHLQDLKEGDLPEAQRVAVLDQIAIFRENAARREREKKVSDDDRERFKNMSSAHVGYGYGQRAFSKQSTADLPKSSDRASSSKSRDTKDPQGYSEPVSFVRPETAEGKGESERTDEEEEAIRQQRRERERALALRDREHRVESRERVRIDNAMREDSLHQQRLDAEAKSRRVLSEQLEHWDDDEVEERGKELFYADRAEWRRERQQQRLREEEDDLEDRRQEDAEVKALETESEDFLRQQMAELNSLEDNQKQSGLLSEDAAPIKVAIGGLAKPPAEAKDDKRAAAAPIRPALALGDDEDDGLVQKKKRALVKLEYEQSLDAAEETARRTARLLELRKRLPSSKSSVFRESINWAILENAATRAKISQLVEGKITNALGELDQDLAEFVMEHISNGNGPNELVDELSPVLAEEAEGVVVPLWRQLVFESEAADLKLDSGSMMV